MSMVEDRPSGDWHISGFDVFDKSPYQIPGTYDNEKDAQAAANNYLQQLEKTQPTALSGGQAPEGIQDCVFVVRPDGTKYRYLG